MPTLNDFKADEALGLAEATAVAKLYCDAEPVSSRMCPFQGMFSSSAIVTLSDETEVVVQLKDNEIDTTKVVLANAFLGDIVPITHAAKTNATFAYVSRFIPGTVWLRMNLSVGDDAKVASQVGSLIARCAMNEASAPIVDRYIIPRLRKTVSKEQMPIELRARIESLIPVAEGLKTLPLSLCHLDINQMNLIIDDGGNVAGLVDWEQAQLLPVGMNAWCIRYLSVFNSARIDYVSEKTQPMAEAFWQGFTASLPHHLLRLLDRVVDAMEIGLVLFVFGEGYSPDKTTVSIMMERLDWFEDTFRPMCALPISETIGHSHP